ncbi:MAG: type 4a pilus biogenesis protein PilO [Candidatus Wallbacteria bacterium]|nr:type 4a pilus biogenesis protein PilO [Candidatus Wallbacteria bacterium]
MGEKSLIFTLFLLILVGMVSTFYFKNYKEYVAERDILRADIQKIKEELEKAKDIDEQIKQARVRLEEINKKMMELAKKIQTEIKVPVILNKIEEYAKQAKVEFKDIKFDNLVEMEAYTDMPISVNITGEFHCLGRFVARLENFKLVVARKGEVTLNATGGDQTAGFNFGTPGYEGLTQFKTKTMIQLTFNFHAYKFTPLDTGGAEQVL